MLATYTASNLCKCKRIHVNRITIRLMYTDAYRQLHLDAFFMMGALKSITSHLLLKAAEFEVAFSSA